MSRLFNYGTPSSNGGWRDRERCFGPGEIDNNVSSAVRPRKNPRVAVPSPFARFQITQEAFKNAANNSVVDDRDLMLVSQVLDVLELIYNGDIERQGLEISRVDLKAIKSTLDQTTPGEESSGSSLLARTLWQYAERENFGLAENPQLFAIARNDEPLAITSPTSLILPSPNYGLWDDIMINGSTPIFSEERQLYQRDTEFILYLFSYIKELAEKNGGSIPEQLKNFGEYLEFQKSLMPSQLQAEIRSLKPISSNQSYGVVSTDEGSIRIWGTDFYAISNEHVTDLISQQSDLCMAPTVLGAPHPLVLSTNSIDYDLTYTSGQTKWDRNDPGFTYDDLTLKNMPIEERVLPNGQDYIDGFIYEHDLLADTLFQLPYKFNSECFFDGNIKGLDKAAQIGFIPPVRKEYFNYFTADDIRKNMRMIAYPSKGKVNEVDRVEVFLNIPTTHGKVIGLKKTYYMAKSVSEAIEDNTSDAKEATGKIIPRFGISLNTLPFCRAHAKNNYYAYQLLFDDTYGTEYSAWLKIGVYNEKDAEDNGVFSRYVRRRAKDNKTPIITSYTLNGGNYDYLILSIGQKFDEPEADALLIPKEPLMMYTPKTSEKLDFCFDFGTSNTFVAVRNSEGKFEDFTLPSESPWLVSTMADDRNREDITVQSFDEYCRQEFLPKLDNRLPFPISTVLSAPMYADEEAVIEEGNESNPFLAASIPFVYGTEDYGSLYNRIISNLKWPKGKNYSSYTLAFIRELMLIAQVFAMSKGAELSKCSVYWTYPLAMKNKLIKSLQDIWESAFDTFFKGSFEETGSFGDDTNSSLEVKSFPESMAPMLYLIEQAKRINETVFSIDIGGGTCDLVVLPDAKVDKMKLASFRLGADCIFGIEGRKASDIKLISVAVKYILATLEKKNSKLNDPEIEKIHKQLKKMLAEECSSSEMVTYLFNLPNNPHLKGMASEISFNRWIQNHDYYHTVFIYYYAALIYYVAQLWKTLDGAVKPERIFFSGGGSRILDIVSGGNRSTLNDITDTLFNLFAGNSLTEDDEEIELQVNREEKEPKQITAKGVLGTVKGKFADKKEEMLAWKSDSDRKKYTVSYKLVDDFDKKEFLYGHLEEDEVIDSVTEKVKDFHEKLTKFIESSDDFDEIANDLKESFTEMFSEKKLRRVVKNYLSSAIEESGEDTDSVYPDVPFFEVVRQMIIEFMVEERM